MIYKKNIILKIISMCIIVTFCLVGCNTEEVYIGDILEERVIAESNLVPLIIDIEEEEETEVDITIEDVVADYLDYNASEYELPLQNSMGISYADTNLKSEPSSSASNIQSISAGDVFLIQEEVSEDWLRVLFEDGTEGYVLAMETLINLPDVVPSICYNLTNSYSSIFKSSGYDIPNVTGYELYNYEHYNERLGYDEYVVAVLYPMAAKICAVQQSALAENNTLVIYEAYRPYDVQMLVGEELTDLASINTEVYSGLNDGLWSIGWFIATSLSNHQKGLAIDTSLAMIVSCETRTSGEYEYIDITEYEEYAMQTDMHELSTAAVSLDSPVSWRTSGSWSTVGTASEMTTGSLILREYCVEYGLEPIASEWWHFNDVEALLEFSSSFTSQSLKFDECISIAP